MWQLDGLWSVPLDLNLQGGIANVVRHFGIGQNLADRHGSSAKVEIASHLVHDCKETVRTSKLPGNHFYTITLASLTSDSSSSWECDAGVCEQFQDGEQFREGNLDILSSDEFASNGDSNSGDELSSSEAGCGAGGA